MNQQKRQNCKTTTNLKIVEIILIIVHKYNPLKDLFDSTKCYSINKNLKINK